MFAELLQKLFKLCEHRADRSVTVGNRNRKQTDRVLMRRDATRMAKRRRRRRRRMKRLSPWSRRSKVLVSSPLPSATWARYDPADPAVT